MNKNLKLIIIIIIIWSIGPLLWQLYTSFSTTENLINPFNITSNRWTLENYTNLFKSDPTFIRFIINSFIVGITTSLFTIIISIPSAYAINKFSNLYQRTFKSILFLTTLFPHILLFLTFLELARMLDLGNNLFTLAIPYTGLSLPLSILLLNSSFKDIPPELEEAANLEGLNLLERLFYIILPIAKPSIASTTILVFLFTWNEYPIALSWITKSNLLTLPVSIARIAGSSMYTVPYGAYAAATVLGSIPLILLVLLFQKQIISGLTNGAIKR